VTQWRFEIFGKENSVDTEGNEILESIRELGITGVQAVQSAKVYLIEGDFDKGFAQRIAKELLADPVCQNYIIGRGKASAGLEKATLVEVHLKSGVTDPVAQSVTEGIADMGEQVQNVRTARKYIILGEVSDKDLQLIKDKVLANDCIEEVIIGDDSEPPSPHIEPYQLELTEWKIRDLSDDQLEQLSKDKDLFLDIREMQTIQQYYKDLGREPTDIEMETLAQTWSEHCVHKTLKSAVDFEYDGEKTHYENLLKDTIFSATQELDKPWCISVFDDNAGIVEFDEDTAVCFKVETHNHPSALDPYGGAATGIGGVIRDPMGTGLGAKPVANTDVFCFGPPDKSIDQIPKGLLHPRRIMKGVVSGVRDYGNRMGIPTVNGAVYFDDRYIANPLVFCGNVGTIPRDKCFKNPQVDNLIMVVGGRTGRDGIHGATFSSGQMTHEHETIFSHAVQIGNPITEKKMLDVLLEANEEGLYEAITDCGAGGLSSAVGEMGEKIGAEVQLDKIPLKYSGLSYTEIWISEAQERMVLAVKPENLEAIKQIFDSEDVEATVIGKFTGDKKLTLNYEGTQVCRLDMEFLHDGLPKYSRKAVWEKPEFAEPDIPQKKNYNKELEGILSSYNVASKEWIIRQYDHEVQGTSAVKPLTGVENDGPSDASVVRVKLDSEKGVAIGCGMNPMYGDIDPYWMALSGIDEAVRNVVCVGGDPERICLLDNFCWGDCRNDKTLGQLVRAAQACRDGSLSYSVPFISGKDSLHNEFECDDGTVIAIPPTLLISAMTIVNNVNNCVTMDVKKPGNLLFVIGETKNELGGSHYYKLFDKTGNSVPKVDLEKAPKIANRIAQAIEKGLIESCHDCSEGGIVVSLAEMGFAGGFGINADLRGVVKSSDVTRADTLLFSESNSRYIVEITPENYDAFAKLMLNLPFGQLGEVRDEPKLTINSEDGKAVIDAEIQQLKQTWQKPLDL
jgi:phosphoribosylformylglycinamidine synthase